MANELMITAKITFNKTPVANITRNETDKTFDVSGKRYSQVVQEVATTEEALTLGDVPSANLGYCWMKNLDPTNFILVTGAAGDVYLMKFKPLESGLFRLNLSIDPFIKADTDPCDVEVLIVED